MWSIILDKDVSAWQKRACESDANIFQLPSWLEAFKQIGYLKPLYLRYDDGNNIGYCGLLVAKMSFIKLALVSNGPVCINGMQPEELIESLVTYFKNNNYSGIRFSGKNTPALVGGLNNEVVYEESFPFYKDIRNHFVVHTQETAEDVKAGFSSTAKRLINKITKDENYRLVIDNKGEYLAEAYELFLRVSERKHFKYRPMSSYKALFNYNNAEKTYASLYLCYHLDKLINAILIIRDKHNSIYMSGGLDTALIDNNTSPSFYLHYQAMLNEFYVHHTDRYNLVYTPGKFGEFKTRFHPEKIEDPKPVTVVLNKWKYSLYSGTMLRFAPKIKRIAKSLLNGK